MAIYTSYYGNRELNPQQQYLVQVSNSAPAGFKVNEIFQDVIPDWNTIVKPYKDRRLSDKLYTAFYEQQLNKRRLQIFHQLEEIYKRAQGKDIVLLCYETPGKFCHRHILAEWLKPFTALNRLEPIHEYTKVQQGRLF